MTPPRQARIRQQLARALAELIAQMHEGGIVHHDLHAGNVLIQLDKDERPCLYLIDLHAVTATGHPLDWPTSRENLIMLNRWFILRQPE